MATRESKAEGYTHNEYYHGQDSEYNGQQLGRQQHPQSPQPYTNLSYNTPSDPVQGTPANARTVRQNNEYSESTASLFSTMDRYKGSAGAGTDAHPGSTSTVNLNGTGGGGDGHADANGCGVEPVVLCKNGKPKKPPRVYKTAVGDFMWRDLLKRKWWKYYAMLLVLAILVGLATIYHDDMIKWLQPFSEKVRDIPFGWTIFVGIMFVISFPPLFGHEVVALICGLCYGLWIGFAVVSLGTILGEWGNFIVFKYACTQRAQKWEANEVNFACIARVIRDGGFRIAFMARLSAIPGHLTTPAFASVGMSFWVFTITAILTLPKQLMTVYLGTVFGEEKPAGITTEKVVEWCVLGASFVITIWAAWYIYAKMAKVRPDVVREMELKKAARSAVLEDGNLPEIQAGLERASSMQMQQLSKTSPTTAYHRSNSKAPIADLYQHGPRDGSLDDGSAPSPQRHKKRWSLGGRRERDLAQQEQRDSHEGSPDGPSTPLVSGSAAPAGYQGKRELYPVESNESQGQHELEYGYGYAQNAAGVGAGQARADSYYSAGAQRQPQAAGYKVYDRQQQRQHRTRTPDEQVRSEHPEHDYVPGRGNPQPGYQYGTGHGMPQPTAQRGQHTLASETYYHSNSIDPPSRRQSQDGYSQYPPTVSAPPRYETPPAEEGQRQRPYEGEDPRYDGGYARGARQDRTPPMARDGFPPSINIVTPGGGAAPRQSVDSRY